MTVCPIPQPAMKLSVFFQHAKDAAAQRGEDLSATLRRFRAAGIETVELDLGDATPETRAVLRDAGLRVGSVPIWFDFADPAFDPADTSFLLRPLAMEATHLLILPALRRPDDAPDAFARTIDGVRAVSAHCRAAGIVPVVENFDDLRSPTCRPGDIARLLAEVPDLAFNFDTGNFAILDESPLDLYPRFSGRIAYLHAKDRSPSPEHGGSPLATQGGATLYGCPVGSGAIPFEALFRRLAADGTDVPVAIECYGVRDMNAAVLESARFLAPLLLDRLPRPTGPLERA